MIKFFGLIPRKPDISSLEFHDHYRHPHGTLGYKNRGYVGYVQSHQMTTSVAPCPASPFEAVAEVWFDNITTAIGLATDPHYLQFVKPDEPTFVDLDRLKWLYTHESILSLEPDPARPADHADTVWLITTAPTTVKLMQFIPESDPLDEAINISLAGRLRALRATRCTPVAQVYATDSPAFGSVREFWWPTESMLIDAVRSDPDAWSQLLQVPPGSESLIARAERFI